MSTRVSDMIPMRDIKQISEGDRLFYELGHKKNPDNMTYKNNWIREREFQEIENVKEFLEGDNLLENVEYLEHHNFMLIKKQIPTDRKRKRTLIKL